jgi:hypothetical protein
VASAGLASAELRRLSAALRAADRTDLQKELTRAMGRASRPLKASARQGAIQILPYRGGLAEEVAGSAFSARVRKVGKGAGVRIRGVDRRAYDLNRMDDGFVRHPVYGHWRKGLPPQRITPGWFTKPLTLDAPKVRDEILQAIDDVAQKLVDSV